MPEVIVIIRGGGSADDLAAFNDEQLVSAIAASRVPTLTGIGHEVDVSLSDLAADVRAATPSNAAQIIVPDRRDVIQRSQMQVQSLVPQLLGALENLKQQLDGRIETATETIERYIEQERQRLTHMQRLLAEFDPARVLERGYALVRGKLVVGGQIEIETARAIIKARIDEYDTK